MEDKLVEIMSDLLCMTTDEFMLNMNDKNIWDSFKKVEIVFSLEEELDLHFREESLSSILSPGDLFREAILMEKNHEA